MNVPFNPSTQKIQGHLSQSFIVNYRIGARRFVYHKTCWGNKLHRYVNLLSVTELNNIRKNVEITICVFICTWDYTMFSTVTKYLLYNPNNFCLLIMCTLKAPPIGENFNYFFLLPQTIRLVGKFYSANRTLIGKTAKIL